MRHLCLVYSVEDPANALSASEEQALTEEECWGPNILNNP